eukprot:TRINITY_DN29041_c0_g1_i1.p1 TRINITY_DN29041_c0_g1~~TRINITY_DN29041_c0_g1_i1.p1  ORF type:complete len:325 (-),score=142.65 TRINITY_DN29041_c0_g1_i1:76-1026(-)
MSDTDRKDQPLAAALESKDCVIFDCDGVLWYGATPVKGAVDVVRALVAAEKRVLFVTNNSSISRREYVKKFSKLGFGDGVVRFDQIYSSSYAAASFLDETDAFDKTTSRAFVVGSLGVMDELAEHGIKGVHADAVLGDKTHLTRQELVDLDPAIFADCGAIIVGGDWNLTYTKTALALICQQLNPGCLFISTNQDASFPVRSDLRLPGSGCGVAMVATALDREPINVGKPEPWLIEMAQRTHSIDPKRTLMVGDRINTDIQFGNSAGLDTLLVLTGVSSLADAAAAPQVQQPDFVADSVADLLAAVKPFDDVAKPQ